MAHLIDPFKRQTIARNSSHQMHYEQQDRNNTIVGPVLLATGFVLVDLIEGVGVGCEKYYVDGKEGNVEPQCAIDFIFLSIDLPLQLLVWVHCPPLVNRDLRLECNVPDQRQLLGRGHPLVAGLHHFDVVAAENADDVAGPHLVQQGNVVRPTVSSLRSFKFVEILDVIYKHTCSQ